MGNEIKWIYEYVRTSKILRTIRCDCTVQSHIACASKSRTVASMDDMSTFFRILPFYPKKAILKTFLFERFHGSNVLATYEIRQYYCKVTFRIEGECQKV